MFEHCSFSRFLVTLILQFQMQFVPKSVPPNPLSIKRLAELVSASNQTLALTGAGMSTESGLPDYRSEGVGLYARTDRRPMEYQTFLRSEVSRKFYWARNFIAWPYFSQVEPNGGHYLLSQWALNNRLFGIITQNVDRLHHRAGPGRILELHGCSHRVICLKCGHISERSELQKRFMELNPSWSKYGATKKELAIAPDGDVELPLDVVQNFKKLSRQSPLKEVGIDKSYNYTNAGISQEHSSKPHYLIVFFYDYQVPSCTQCLDGILKPDVTFFGENLPPAIKAEAAALVDQADLLLCLGTSVQTFSSFRLLLQANQLRIPIAIVNIGPTRADNMAGLIINSRIFTTLKQVDQLIAN
ncbi:hypothetical protein EG68_05991 [Paragonimus skrjabini miyazakii]|uniref:Deacetylase sirtuin-type domain-containing protein n=1 Tax=Paragonimus skrjabini miyazakii TaxID=59628 RepID=A0A8S9YQW4_9TREM|nr:hypothetical protein EG68_05991 [Paragonimus skrjabini miyazakii]